MQCAPLSTNPRACTPELYTLVGGRKRRHLRALDLARARVRQGLGRGRGMVRGTVRSEAAGCRARRRLAGGVAMDGHAAVATHAAARQEAAHRACWRAREEEPADGEQREAQRHEQIPARHLHRCACCTGAGLLGRIRCACRTHACEEMHQLHVSPHAGATGVCRCMPVYAGECLTLSVGKLARLVLASTRLVHAQPTCRVRVLGWG